jgi:hypothetical protein
MPEGLSKFSDEEREAIHSTALRLAHTGERGIDAFFDAYVELTKTSLLLDGPSVDVQIGGEKLTLTRKNLKHELQVVNQVIFQARTIRAVLGVDTNGQIERFKATGDKSIFDS